MTALESVVSKILVQQQETAARQQDSIDKLTQLIQANISSAPQQHVQSFHQESLMDVICKSIQDFRYAPDSNQVFSSWYSRYEEHFTADAKSLSEAQKTNILLRKLSLPVYERYADFIYVFVPMSVAAYGQIESQTRRCGVLKNMAMHRICVGKYPKEISVKYHDHIVKTGATYAIFQVVDSPLLKCEKAKMINSTWYDCGTENGKIKQISVKGFLRCITTHLQLVDDLLKLCTGQQMDRSVFFALHYKLDELPFNTPNAYDATTSIQTLFFLTVVLLVLHSI